MKIEGDLIFIYDSMENAKIVFNSLDIDNEKFLKSQLNNITAEYKLTSDKLGTFLSTADDLIASEIVAEKIVEKTKE